jgi:hypothetical protein
MDGTLEPEHGGSGAVSCDEALHRTVITLDADSNTGVDGPQREPPGPHVHAGVDFDARDARAAHMACSQRSKMFASADGVLSCGYRCQTDAATAARMSATTASICSRSGRVLLLYWSTIEMSSSR